MPGVDLKMVPVDGKQELRLKGPNVMPGYWKDSESTRRAFDEDGFLCMGDAVRFLDPNDPCKGLVFDGRLSENFKLMSGTWVRVGELRWTVVQACDPIVQDVAITGHDRNELGVLVFLNAKVCQSMCAENGDLLDMEALVKHPKVRSSLLEKLRAYNRLNSGNSTKICRALLLTKPADSDANEINDKGYLNQRAVLAHRAHLVEKLYAAGPNDHEVLIIT
jgi:feruloyl-CoA synthase